MGREPKHRGIAEARLVSHGLIVVQHIQQRVHEGSCMPPPNNNDDDEAATTATAAAATTTSKKLDAARADSAHSG